MTTSAVELTLQSRDLTGKKVKHMRAAGEIPVVLHNHGKESTVAKAEAKALQAVVDQVGQHQPVTLKVDGKDHMAMIKDIDRDPVRGDMRHVVFNAIRKGEKVATAIPLVAKEHEEQIPAEVAGFLVVTHMNEVDIEAIPSNLPDHIEYDVSALAEIGDKITVADLVAPEGVTITAEADSVVVTVDPPRAEEEPEVEEEEIDAADIPSDHGEAAEESSEDSEKEKSD